MVTKENVLLAYAVSTTGMGEFGSIFCVAALNSFTKSIMFRPCGPNACPMAGPGFATPAGQRSRMTALTPAIVLCAGGPLRRSLRRCGAGAFAA